jgi:hypothetical protein
MKKPPSLRIGGCLNGLQAGAAITSLQQQGWQYV